MLFFYFIYFALIGWFCFDFAMILSAKSSSKQNHQNKLLSSNTVTGTQNLAPQLLDANTVSQLYYSGLKGCSLFGLDAGSRVFNPKKGYQSKSNYKASLLLRCFGDFVKQNHQDQTRLYTQYINDTSNSSFSRNNLSTKNFKWLFSPEQISSFLLQEKPKFLKAESKFAIKLRELRKIRSFYGNLSLKYLKKVIKKSNYGLAYQRNEIILTILESRLDVVLYRSGFFESIATAKQWILTSGVYINQKKVISPAVSVLPGDIVSLFPKRAFEKKSQLRNNLLVCNEIVGVDTARNLKIKQENRFKKHFSTIDYFPFFEDVPYSYFGISFTETVLAFYAKQKREAFRAFRESKASVRATRTVAEPVKEVNRAAELQFNLKPQVHGDLSKKDCYMVALPRVYYREKSGVSHFPQFSFRSEQMPCFMSSFHKFDKQIDSPILKNKRFLRLKTKQKKWRFKASPFRVALLRSNINGFIKPSKKSAVFVKEWIEKRLCKTDTKYEKRHLADMMQTLLFPKEYWLSLRQSFSFFDIHTKTLNFSHSLFFQFASNLQNNFSKSKGVDLSKGLVGLQEKKEEFALLKDKEQGIGGQELALQSKNLKKEIKSNFISNCENKCFYTILFLSYTLFLKKQFLFLSSKDRKVTKRKNKQNTAVRDSNSPEFVKQTIRATRTTHSTRSVVSVASSVAETVACNRNAVLNSKKALGHHLVLNKQNQSKVREKALRFKSLPLYWEAIKKEKATCFEKQKKAFFFKEQSFFASKKSKPLHLEVSYKSLSFIFLFNPQRICFPFFINVSQIYK